MNSRIVQLAALTACVLLGGSAFAQTAEQHPRSINVNGYGEVKGEPDKATLTLGIEARKPELEAARAEVLKGVEAVLELTREMKIDQKSVRATRIHVQPEYNYLPARDGSPPDRKLIGYYVSRQIEVELDDLSKLGTLIERAVDLGVNQIGDPQLDSSRRHELQREALAKAVEDARRNAEVVAKAAGAKVGAVRVLNASTPQPTPPPMPMMMMRASALEASDKAAGTYQSGEMTFSSSVYVQYDLIPE
ncbi:MAG TPA: SIMPL domain-containing protein [Steroidobacteraceae bacterium]